MVKKVLWVFILGGIISCGFDNNTHRTSKGESWYGKAQLENEEFYKRFLESEGFCENRDCNQFQKAPFVEFSLYEGDLPAYGDIKISAPYKMSESKKAVSQNQKQKPLEAYRTMTFNVGEIRPLEGKEGFSSYILKDEFPSRLKIKSNADIKAENIPIQITYKGYVILEVDMTKGKSRQKRDPQSAISSWSKIKRFFKRLF